MLSTSKVKRSRKFVWELPDGIWRLIPKSKKKIIGTPNQPIDTKNFLQKGMFSTSKVKRSQKFVWRLLDGICRLNPKSKKKTIATPNLPIRTKIFTKRYV
jgi:hypothetical protein